MKNRILIILSLLFSNMAISQSLTIYRTDQTSINFELSDVDSITFSVTSLAKTLELSNREYLITEQTIKKFNSPVGVFERVAEGLKINGNDNQTSQTIRLASIAENPIMDKNIYLKWKIDGNGNAINITIILYADTIKWSPAYQINNFTAHYSSNDPKVISDNTWYYTRISVNSNKAISTTSTENYDNHGGTIIQDVSINLVEPVKTFTFGVKANKESYAILGEVRIE